MKLNINKEFKNLIPALTADEYKQLEANLIEEGCRDALVIWNGTIIDGHNRYEICQKQKIAFDTQDIEFADDNEAKIWIIKNQFGRRNINNATRAMLALELEPLIKEKAKENLSESGGDRKSETAKSGLQNSVKAIKPINTQKEVADIAGLSHSTIHEAKKVKESGNQEVIDKMKAGTMSIHKAYKEVMPKRETQVCSQCEKELPATEFSRNTGPCKKCDAFRKRVGANQSKKIRAFNGVDVDAIIDSMAKKEPSANGSASTSNNHIITEYLNKIKQFRNDIGKYQYITNGFSEIEDPSLVVNEIEELISELDSSLKIIKEIK